MSLRLSAPVFGPVSSVGLWLRIYVFFEVYLRYLPDHEWAAEPYLSQAKK